MTFDAHHLPQVDQESRDQIRNKWVAAPGATAKYADIDDYPSRVLARLDRREPIRVPDHNPQGESPTFSPCEVLRRGDWPIARSQSFPRMQYVYLNN